MLQSVYYIRTYLLAPYKNYGTLIASQINYNKKLFTCCLRQLQCSEIDIRFLNLQNLLCCILYNVCIDRCDLIDFEECEEFMDNPIEPLIDSDIQ